MQHTDKCTVYAHVFPIQFSIFIKIPEHFSHSLMFSIIQPNFYMIPQFVFKSLYIYLFLNLKSIQLYSISSCKSLLNFDFQHIFYVLIFII